MNRGAGWTDTCVSWCLGTRVFRDERRLKVEPKAACFKEWMCRERKSSNETSRADDMWVKEQIVVDCWKVFILFLLLNIPCPF